MKSQEEKLNKFSDIDKEKIINEYICDLETFSVNFIINEKPVPYARARLGRSGIFYNPKSSIERKYKNIFFNELPQTEKEKIIKLLKSETAEYYVKITGDFFVPTQQNDSAKTILLKEEKIIRPELRNGDIDNYMKLILDALHGVIYNDDKIVMSISANKYYSIKPRSEIKVEFIVKHY